MTEIIVISAVSDNGVIGRDNKIPWHIREDLLRFKKMTMGYPVIMGRKTWESLGCRPLPGRRNIVLSSRHDYPAEGCEVFHSLEQALAAAVMSDKIFIIGGETIYRESMKFADTIELTRVHENVAGDVFFPDFDLSQWKQFREEKRDGFSFLSYKRKKRP